MLLKRLSGERQSNHLTLEKLPEVEEVPIHSPELDVASSGELSTSEIQGV
jgi:hypothetical protein